MVSQPEGKHYAGLKRGCSVQVYCKLVKGRQEAIGANQGCLFVNHNHLLNQA